MFTACGSTLYIAPEVLTAKASGKGYGVECDLWAVGVITYILLCCRPPFSGATSWHVGQAIQKGDFNYPEYALVSKGARELIQGLLEIDPHKRLTCKQALNTPWLQAVAPPGDTSDSHSLPVMPRSLSLASWLRSIVNTLAGVSTSATSALTSAPSSAASTERCTPSIPLPV